MNRYGVFCLRAVTQADLPEAYRFLQNCEYGCTGLSALFIRRTAIASPYTVALPPHNRAFVLEYVNGTHTFSGLLHYSSSGVLHHSFPFFEVPITEPPSSAFAPLLYAKQNSENLRLVCTEFLEKHCPSSIMGSSGAGVFLENCMCNPVSESRSCTLMSAGNPFSALPDSTAGRREEQSIGTYKVRRCTPDDLHGLFPLVKAYYEEEVLPAGMYADDTSLRLLLNNRLKNQLVFAAEDKTGGFAAMAGTTALGIQYAQIGGVYTAPQVRRQGIASMLLRYLRAELACLRYTPVLFVRSVNAAAEALYKKLGFIPCGTYRISYF